MFFLYSFISRVASGPGISGNLEKSGNFVTFEKSGKSREFRKIRKSQGIFKRIREKSRNLTCSKLILPKFKIHSSCEQELTRMLMDFYLRIKMNLNCRIVSFWIKKCTVTD